MIYLRPKHLLIPKREITMQPRMAGYYKIEAVRLDGTKRLLADWFPNLILDAGLNRWGTGAIISHCQVGTGNTAPANTDTALVTYVAGSSTQQAASVGAQGTAPYYGFRQITFRFATGVATGTLAEVGVGWAISGSLFSRALILDGGGSPTTITVLADETLDVTYELRFYPPLVDVVDTINISGVDYDYTLRAALVTNSLAWALNVATLITTVSATNYVAYSGAVGAITSSPSGTTGSSSSAAAAAYSNNSLQRDFTVTWGLNNGNVSGGIMSVGFNTSSSDEECGGAYQVEFDPVIPKDATKTLSLSYRVQWARGSI